MKTLYVFPLLLTMLTITPGWASERSKDSYLQYQSAIKEIFSPYLEFEASAGEDGHCSLLFTVDEEGVIRKIAAKSCDLAGEWELALLKAVAQMRDNKTLPPSSQVGETNQREIVFFRANNSTTASPPLRDIAQPVQISNLPPLKVNPALSKEQNAASDPREPALSAEEIRARQIEEELKNEQTFDGVRKSKDKLLADARKQKAQTESCPPNTPRLNIDAIPTYLARSEAISFEVAKAIEDYTASKTLRYEAIDLFNKLVTKSNSLIRWGNENRVNGACGSKSLVERLSKENAARRELIKQFKVVLDKG